MNAQDSIAQNTSLTITERIRTLKLTLRYAYRLERDDTVIWSAPVVGTGGSSNEQLSYALKGALTNAIGTAFSKMCWQLLIYKGKLNHGNAKKMYQAQQDRLAKASDGYGSDPAITVSRSGETSTVEVESPTMSEETSLEESFVEAPVEKPAAEETSAEEPVTEEPTVEEIPMEEPDADEQLQLAEVHVIPDNIRVPMAGKTLGQARKDASLGKPILTHLAGYAANRSNKMFEPNGDDNHQKLQDAAKLICDAEGYTL